MPVKDVTAISAHAAAEENASENLSRKGFPAFRQRVRQRLSKDLPSRMGCDFKRLSTSSSSWEGFLTAERTMSAKLSPQRMGLAVMRVSKKSRFLSLWGLGWPDYFCQSGCCFLYCQTFFNASFNAVLALNIHVFTAETLASIEAAISS